MFGKYPQEFFPQLMITFLQYYGVPVIGGFLSPMEQECLALLLRGTQPIIICPAQGMSHLVMDDLLSRHEGPLRL
jgi:hypothetical protein